MYENDGQPASQSATGGHLAGGSVDQGNTDPGELEGLMPLYDDAGNELDEGQPQPRSRQQQQTRQPGGDPDEGSEGGDPDAEGNEPGTGEGNDDGQQLEAEAITDDREIELDGGSKVTMRELKQTFATFQQKTHEHAIERQQITTQAREAVAGYAERQAQTLHALAQQVESLATGGLDEQQIMRLAYSSDPQELMLYQQLNARLQIARQVRAQAEQQAAQYMEQAQAMRERERTDAIEARKQLVQSELTKLTGQKWWNADFQTKALAYTKRLGIPEAEVRSLPYAGAWQLIRKAMAYDEAVARTKGGKQPPAPARVAPGATPARGQFNKARQQQQSYERAAKSGDRTAMGHWLNEALGPLP